MGDVTVLLKRARGNDPRRDRRAVRVALRRPASPRAFAPGGERPSDAARTPRALVHEAYLRFQQAERIALNDREHFLAYAATTLRSIVVDHVRKRNAERRGGDLAQVTLDTDVADQLVASDEEILEVHDALDAARARRPAPGARGRDALLRRPHRGRDRGGARRQRAHRAPRLGKGARAARGHAAALNGTARDVRLRRRMRGTDMRTCLADSEPPRDERRRRARAGTVGASLAASRRCPGGAGRAARRVGRRTVRREHADLAAALRRAASRAPTSRPTTSCAGRCACVPRGRIRR